MGSDTGVDPKEDGWRLIRESSLDIPLGPDTGHPSPTWQVFSENFERRLQHASEYVSLHVSDRGTLERIVTRLVITSPGLMNRHVDDRVDTLQLQASADRLIALEKNLWTSRGNLESMHGEQDARMRHQRSFVSGPRKRRLVAGRMDEIKGRAKQAAGVLAGDRELEAEGRVHRAAGKVKQTAQRVAGAVKSILRRNRK